VTGSRRPLRPWVVALALPLLALRALIPAGFMASPVAGSLQLVFCGVGHHDHAHPSTVGDPTCPFAQSAGPAPLPSLPVVPTSIEAVAFALPAASSQTVPQYGPLRRPIPRGPPALA
jgi:hypothetical protein